MSAKRLRLTLLIVAIAGVSLLHYETAISHVWLHPLLQRAYYVPILLMALWFGWRGGIFAAFISGIFYTPHILMSWRFEPEYRAAQIVEVGMFFVIGTLTGVMADQERAQRAQIQETARKLSEVNAQLQASFEQLRRADRLSALGELSAGLAHEIRNPLGSIEGAVQILRRPELPLETRDEFGDLAQKEVNRLKSLVTNFLDFARPQPPKRGPTEPARLLESVSRLAAETAKMSGTRVRVEPGDDVPPVLVDAEQMKQVLLNLVINAIQAMRSGGEVLLRATTKSASVVLEVQDEGVGIPPEDLERVFNPFVTTRPDGTGLGLSIAYQIVRQHGGHIAARRNPDKGMTFTVTLPLGSEANLPETITQGEHRA
ncbi:MAG TPA: ATP-binding protein [Candidatus Binatia bacterium]|nr:ATP-binding protein [Candidatus Binatia bacterium]